MDKTLLKKRILQKIPDTSTIKYDLSPVFADSELFSDIICALSEPYRGKIEMVLAPEALGWAVASAVAFRLCSGLVIVRKGGHFTYRPEESLCSQSFVDYDGRQKTLQLAKEVPLNGKHVLLVDEWIATGAQIQALLALVRRFSCSVEGICTIGAEKNSVTQAWAQTNLLNAIFWDGVTEK